MYLECKPSISTSLLRLTHHFHLSLVLWDVLIELLSLADTQGWDTPTETKASSEGRGSCRRDVHNSAEVKDSKECEGVAVALVKRLKTGLCRASSRFLRGYFSFQVLEGNTRTALYQWSFSRTSRGFSFFLLELVCVGVWLLNWESTKMFKAKKVSWQERGKKGLREQKEMESIALNTCLTNKSDKQWTFCLRHSLASPLKHNSQTRNAVYSNKQRAFKSLPVKEARFIIRLCNVVRFHGRISSYTGCPHHDLLATNQPARPWGQQRGLRKLNLPNEGVQRSG